MFSLPLKNLKIPWAMVAVGDGIGYGTNLARTIRVMMTLKMARAIMVWTKDVS